MGMDTSRANTAVQAQYSKNAHKYVTSPVHAQGEDLPWIVETAKLAGTERVLDVGTGTGHTALALAPGSRTVMGADLTAKMVEAAAALAVERDVANVQFVVSDVVALPFPSSFFDLVTCRFASHHFADPDGALAEMARVLKPGGRLILVDHVAPEDPGQDTFINRLDLLRDPSHVREWKVSEWQEKLGRVGIEAQVERAWHLPMEYDWWVRQAGTAADRQDQIVQMLQGADEETRSAFHIRLDEGGKPLGFAIHCVLIHGRKRG